MSTHLYLAPAAAGKTAYVLARARDASRDLAAVPRVVVPTHLQARAARRRLAERAMPHVRRHRRARAYLRPALR